MIWDFRSEKLTPIAINKKDEDSLALILH